MIDTARDVVLPKEITEHLEGYFAAFNKGDADAVNRHYTADGVTVWEPGKPVGGAEREKYVKEFFAGQKPRMSGTVKEAHVTGDTALLVVDWTMEITGSGGGAERLSGTGLDVLRRQDDGSWLYAVDDPFGERIRTDA